MNACSNSCETTCETTSEVICDIHLYDLFPWIIRYKDALAQGSLEAEGILEKVTYALEQEVCVTRDEITALATLLDADTVDPSFLLYLSATLGTMVGLDATLGIEHQRWLVKNLIAFHKIKGTHPSWHQRFGHFFRNGTLGFWYRTWELWKTIPYENFTWCRVQGYVCQLRAARYDLYYLDEEGNPVFLEPDEAQALLPYTDDARPIHVLPRSYVRRQDISDTIDVPTEELSSVIRASGDFFTDQPDELTDNLFVELQCGTACETGTCEGYCEMSCTAAACEFACQQACTTGVETEVFPGPDPEFEGYPGYSCKYSCEGGACEAGCQIGSCQSGCQSASELEKFPAHVDTVSPGATDTVLGRVWFPHPGMTFPPNATTDPWWITPVASPINLTAERIGTGTFGTSTLIPALISCKWVEVTCVPGVEFTEVHAFPGDGVNILWTGNLASQPHPGSVRVEAELDVTVSDLTVDANKDSNTVVVANAALFTVGDEVQIVDDNHAEPNIIEAITAPEVYLKNALRENYTVVDNGMVRRVERKLVSHTAEMDTPVDANTWYGLFGGDIDEDVVVADRRANYRSPWNLRVTFKEPPPIGADIRVYYIRESECVYWIEQTFQSISTDTLAINTNSELGFIAGTSTGQIWYWDGTQWQLHAPAASDGKDYALTINNGVLTWIEIKTFVCP